MFRPARRHFDSSGYIRISGAGYYWYWLKKAETLSKSRLKTNRVWVEDGGRIFYACPNCGTFTESYCDRDGNRECIINGRDIDTIQCEACHHCMEHYWLTFGDAVTRKTSGAIRLHPKKCPSCRRSEVRTYDYQREHNFYGIAAFMVAYTECLSCHRKWRVEPFEKEK